MAPGNTVGRRKRAAGEEVDVYAKRTPEETSRALILNLCDECCKDTQSYSKSCLSPHPFNQQCDRKCKHCSRPHHNSICDSNVNNSKLNQSSVNAVVTTNQPVNGVARLFTASAILQNPVSNQSTTRHVLLDTGGMMSFISLKPLSAQDYAVVQAHCGNHPHLTENTIVSPDLLISITETQDLLADSTTIILPSGYKLVQSILGPMITGRTNSRNSSIQYKNNILTSLTIQRSDDPVPLTADPPYTRVVVCSQSPLIDLTRYSTLNKAIRITGFILRFVQRTLKNSTNITLKQKYDSSFTSSSLLSAFERTRALQSLIRNHQSCHIKPHEVWIRNGLISQDDYGIWRANTRLDHAAIQAETRRPILIPSNEDSRLARLIIDDTHEFMFHAGTENVLNQLKQQYWIPRSRQLVKSQVRSCITCRKANNLPYQYTQTPPFPPDRVSV
uniref:Integrase_H2C2 domain-containing protein n=1 Tax=Pristionchus pacificus TaxID=54126 RepID=H3FMV8_PRIPA